MSPCEKLHSEHPAPTPDQGILSPLFLPTPDWSAEVDGDLFGLWSGLLQPFMSPLAEVAEPPPNILCLSDNWRLVSWRSG